MTDKLDELVLMMREQIKGFVESQALTLLEEISDDKPDGKGVYGIWLEEKKHNVYLFFNYFPRSGDVNCYISKKCFRPSIPLDESWIAYRTILTKGKKLSMTEALEIAKEFENKPIVGINELFANVVDDVRENFNFIVSGS